MQPAGFREPTHPRTRRLGARDAIVCVAVAVLVLLVLEGGSIRRSGERMEPGVLRTVVLAVGHPAGWLSDRVGLAEAADDATAFLSPDDDLAGDNGGFAGTARRAEESAVPAVPVDAFDPRDLDQGLRPERALRRLLVTGDSMAMPLDAALARRLVDRGPIHVAREPHVGTGISKSGLVDWGKLSVRQVRGERPDAVVVFLGANEGFPMRLAGAKEVACCAREWTAEYAFRVRQVMSTYRRGGQARVYWLTLALPRDEKRIRVARAVNAAIRVAAQPYRAHVRVLDLEPLFTPGRRFRDELLVDGKQRLVRDADGIHLNAAGAELAADVVLRALAQDFRLG